MRFVLPFLCLVASCYSPKHGNPGFYCHPEDVPACPDGQQCVGGRCVNNDFDAGLAGRDLAMPSDGGGMPPDMTTGGGSCMSAVMCMGAVAMGNINADSGGTQTANGDKSQWLKVQTIENNNAPFSGQRMRLRATLTSPATTNFDLYVYLNVGGTAPECTVVTGSSMATGTSDVVNIDWGETDGDIANGSSDNALVTIEVRAATAATCAPGQTWSLEAKGGL
jgi:hypothetical protein